MIGINIKGEGTIWLEDSSGLEVGVKLNLNVAGKVFCIVSKKYQRDELQDGKGTRTGIEWSKGIVSFFP